MGAEMMNGEDGEVKCLIKSVKIGEITRIFDAKEDAKDELGSYIRSLRDPLKLQRMITLSTSGFEFMLDRLSLYHQYDIDEKDKRIKELEERILELLNPQMPVDHDRLVAMALRQSDSEIKKGGKK